MPTRNESASGRSSPRRRAAARSSYFKRGPQSYFPHHMGSIRWYSVIKDHMPHDDRTPPKEMPEPGYYYHYKHDPTGPVNNYAYYIYGVGHHTEDDCRPEDTFMQVYRPLYESYVYKMGKMFDLRPLHMFYEPATREGKPVSRFMRITDAETIALLKAIKLRMYGEE